MRARGVDPAFWRVVPKFGKAGGPMVVTITEVGRARAWSVGAQVRPGAPAKALEALYANGGEAPYAYRRGPRMERAPYAIDHDHLSLSYLRSLGHIKIEAHPNGETIRLTPAGRLACVRALAEIEALLERVREAHGTEGS